MACLNWQQENKTMFLQHSAQLISVVLHPPDTSGNSSNDYIPLCVGAHCWVWSFASDLWLVFATGTFAESLCIISLACSAENSDLMPPHSSHCQSVHADLPKLLTSAHYTEVFNGIFTSHFPDC